MGLYIIAITKCNLLIFNRKLHCNFLYDATVCEWTENDIGKWKNVELLLHISQAHKVGAKGTICYTMLWI